MGMVWALRGRLHGHARAVLATSLLHILAHLYLADDRHDDGQDGGMSRRADAPASTSSRALRLCASLIASISSTISRSSALIFACD